MSDGRASGTKMVKAMRVFVAPAEIAASTTPLSISANADSTTRATRGAAAMANGTTAAEVPMLVPTKNLDNGNSIIMRIMKGKERSAFMTRSSMRRGVGRSESPPGAMRYSSSPLGAPNKTDKIEQ